VEYNFYSMKIGRSSS